MFSRTSKILRASAQISLGVAALCTLWISVPASAGPTEEFEAAFAVMMENPGDLKATMDYANAAAAVGNYEAAIPALERILFFNPELASVKLELGVMYMKLGSNDVARDYLAAARAEGDADVSGKAASYLEAMGG